MRKKYVITILLTMLFFFLLIVCSYNKNEKMSINKNDKISIKDIINNEHINITKVIIYDGRGGYNKPLTLESKKKIRTLMDYLYKYVIKKVNHAEPAVGWSHKVILYDGYKEVMSIILNNPLEINNEYYSILEGTLDSKEIDKLINSIDKNWSIIPYS